MVEFCRTAPTGNIFYILGRAGAELKRAGRDDESQTMFDRVTESGSYDEALKIISEYVDLEESDE